MKKTWLLCTAVLIFFQGGLIMAAEQFEKGKLYAGFELKEERFIPEINATSRLFIHVQSGATLMYLSNDDDNKSFAITFKTPPSSSNGAPHIMEHSVLCGSRKFPTKEPFIELSKGSLNTFLNAMTSVDHTTYPVASRNNKDFRNLVDVYLDAVFFPKIHTVPEILMQEGWHYELKKIEDPIIIKGVVYNEMKGVYSSPDTSLFSAISNALFPDTLYHNDSGGNPDVIPALTQKEFSEFHKKYYQPSNSFIFIYGDGSVEQDLAFIDKEYLSLFNNEKSDVSYPMQPAFTAQKDVTVKYAVSKGTPVKNKAYLSLSMVISPATPELREAFDVIDYVLFGNPSSPLRKALLDSGIGKNCYGYFDDGAIQPSYSIVLANADESRKNEFLQIIRSTLEGLVKNGIDKKLIESAINSKEFRLREASYNRFPKGLVYNSMATASWLYGGDPNEYLAFDKHFVQLKKALKEPYLESFIKKYMLDNNHSAVVTSVPEPGLAEKQATELAAKLDAYKKSLGKKDLEAIIANTNALIMRQSTPDSPENLATIPQLTREDLTNKSQVVPVSMKKLGYVPVIHTPVFTNGIVYTQMSFNTIGVPQELLHYIPLMVSVMRKLDTAGHSYGDLANEINIHTGGISIRSEIISNKNGSTFTPLITVTGKAVYAKLPQLLQLEREILLTTNYSDMNRLKDIIREIRASLDDDINSNGGDYAESRLSSRFSAAGPYDDFVNGLDYLAFIHDIDTNFDLKSKTIIHNLQKTAEMIFNVSALTAGVTIPEADYSMYSKEADAFIHGLPTKQMKKNTYSFKPTDKNEAFYGTSKVQYVYQGFNYRKLGYDYTGTMRVMRNILRNDYLWNTIRVQGGAYGAYLTIGWDGYFVFGSYRDPNLKETLDAYKNSVTYLEKFKADEREMTKYIIGAIGDLDMPMTAQMKGNRSMAMYFNGITNDDYQRERDEILAVTPEKIRSYAALIKAVIDAGQYSAFGGEGTVLKYKDLFGSVRNLEK